MRLEMVIQGITVITILSVAFELETLVKMKQTMGAVCVHDRAG